MEECMTLLAGSIMAATVVLPCYAIFKMVLEPPEDEYKYDGEREIQKLAKKLKISDNFHKKIFKTLIGQVRDLQNKINISDGTQFIRHSK